MKRRRRFRTAEKATILKRYLVKELPSQTCATSAASIRHRRSPLKMPSGGKITI